jgi:enamine deaminase RidA (YjgF/YER057c/UK114 family)
MHMPTTSGARRLAQAFVVATLVAGTLGAQPVRSSPASLPPTGGRYTHVVSAELPPGSRLVMIAGQVGADSTGRIVSTDAKEQMRVAYDNLDRALRAAGATWDDVLKTSTILTKAADVAVLRQFRAERFVNRTAPANTLLVVQALYDPAVVFEVEAIAVVTGGRPAP